MLCYLRITKLGQTLSVISDLDFRRKPRIAAMATQMTKYMTFGILILSMLSRLFSNEFFFINSFLFIAVLFMLVFLPFLK